MKTVHRCISAIPAIVLAAALSCDVAAQDDLRANLQRGTFARAVERAAPRYPSVELGRGRQGWVKLSYVVTTDGKAVDPVIEDSSGSRNFEKAAVRVVKKWVFEPATWDGEPVEQCHNETLISFKIESTPTGASPKFARRYRSILENINNGDIAGAEEKIDEVFDDWKLTVYEVSRLWVLHAALYQKKGDRKQQLASFHKAIVNNGNWIEEDLYESVLSGIVALELVSGEYSSAIDHYEALLETGATAEEYAELAAAVQSVRDQVAGGTLLAVRAALDSARQCEGCTADWQYALLRNQFSFSEVQGSLDTFELRCDWKRLVDSAREGAKWTIPESWGSCRLIVFGDAGTTFNLLEHPTAI